MMKKLISIIGYWFLFMSLAGCASIKSILPHKTTKDAIAVSPFPLYSGLKARIAVTDFDVKAAKATSDIGSDLRNMLTAALISSNHFSITEQPASVAATQTQDSSGLGVIQQESSATQKDKIKSADLIIATAVTEFNPQASGGREGIGGAGGIGNGAFGGLLGEGLNKAFIALEIRIIDTSTSGTLAVSRVQGQASDIADISSGEIFGKGGLGTALSAYANSPMEKAIYICIIEAVRYISQTIPITYYNY